MCKIGWPMSSQEIENLKQKVQILEESLRLALKRISDLENRNSLYLGRVASNRAYIPHHPRKKNHG